MEKTHTMDSKKSCDICHSSLYLSYTAQERGGVETHAVYIGWASLYDSFHFKLDRI